MAIMEGPEEKETYQPKNIAWPSALSIGLMRMKRVSIHTAMEHLNSSLRSLALKWSINGANRPFLGRDALAEVKNELSSSPLGRSGDSEPPD